jgi:hypothetical protein
MDTSLATKRQHLFFITRWPNLDNRERIEPAFFYLYSNQKKKLKVVGNELQEEYGVCASYASSCLYCHGHHLIQPHTASGCSRSEFNVGTWTRRKIWTV